METQSSTRLLYAIEDAARQLSISKPTLERLIANKKIAVRRIGRRTLVEHGELVRFSRKDTPVI